jgi:hypothetical protein
VHVGKLVQRAIPYTADMRNPTHASEKRYRGNRVLLVSAEEVTGV